MRAQQTGFDFNLFDMAGFTAPTVDDGDWARREARKAQADQERRERETRERFQREQREREEQARRARSRSRQYEAPWDILGIPANANKSQVRSAWAKLCKQFHPDAVGGSDEAIKRVNAAYQQMKGMAR